MTTLLDGNVLIALSAPEHTHYESARQWLVRLPDSFATCPITQGTLLRYLLMRGSNATDAKELLGDITVLPRHIFWPDAITYAEVRMTAVIGHRQVTDAYLAQLARANNGRLATFDTGLAALHADVVELIPVGQ